MTSHSDQEQSSQIDEENEITDAQKKAHLSERGIKMADSLAEYMLTRYFFGPNMKDRKKYAGIKKAFINDMQFNLNRGNVIKSTIKLNNRRFTDEILKFYDQDSQEIPDQLQKKIITLLDDMRFMQNLKNFSATDKLDFIRILKFKKITAGQRITSYSNTIDSFNLIIKGQVGIFYPDLLKIKLLQNQIGRIVTLNLEESKNQAQLVQAEAELANQAKLKKAVTSKQLNKQQTMKMGSSLSKRTQIINEQTKVAEDQVKYFLNYFDVQNLERKADNPLYDLKPNKLLQQVDLSTNRELIIERLNPQQNPQSSNKKELLQHALNFRQKNSEFLKSCSINLTSNNKSRINFSRQSTTSIQSLFDQNQTQINMKPGFKIDIEEEISDSDSALFEKDDKEDSINEAVLLTEQTCPILRDSKDNYSQLERLFGTLTSGMVFGESALIESKQLPKFYNAYALTNCYYFQIQKSDYDFVLNSQEKRSLGEKMQFIKTIPEFYSQALPRSKLQSLCKNLYPLQCKKNEWLYKEGQLCQDVYFIKSGEVKICMRVSIPQLNDHEEQFQNLLSSSEGFASSNPRQQTKLETHIDSKQYVVGLVSQGYILGLEDAILSKKPVFSTGVIGSQVDSMTKNIELYRIDREIFNNILKPTTQVWYELIKKSQENIRSINNRIKNMKFANLQIMDVLNRTDVNEQHPRGQSRAFLNLLDDIATNGYNEKCSAIASKILAARKQQTDDIRETQVNSCSVEKTPEKNKPQIKICGINLEKNFFDAELDDLQPKNSRWSAMLFSKPQSQGVSPCGSPTKSRQNLMQEQKSMKSLINHEVKNKRRCISGLRFLHQTRLDNNNRQLLNRGSFAMGETPKVFQKLASLFKTQKADGRLLFRGKSLVDQPRQS